MPEQELSSVSEWLHFLLSWSGFVQPRMTPSEALRRCPLTHVCLYLLRCFRVSGKGKVLLST